MMKKAVRLLQASVFAGLLLAVSGCSDDLNSWQKHELKLIDEYIAGLGDTSYVKTESGLYYIELQAGTGETAHPGDTVIFWYKGMFINYEEFDSNMSPGDPPYIAILGKQDIKVKGLEEGIALMKRGEKARFLTPSNLAYGHEGIYGIVAGYTPLLWDVILIDIRRGQGR